MLKPQELFIGAAVYPISTDSGIYIPVEIPFVIYEIHFGQVKAYKLGEFPYKLTEDGFSIFGFSELSPIPITPEILTDWCGWNQDKDKVYKPIHAKGVNKIMIAFWKSHRDIQLWQFGEFITSLPHVKYLHQLQALYLLLTGEVMPIKLPKE